MRSRYVRVREGLKGAYAPALLHASSEIGRRFRAFAHALASPALLAPLLLLLGALLWSWFDPGNIIDRQRRSVFDYYQRLAPRTYQDTPVRIVDIDDASLARVGQWPWPRSAVAAMVSRLAASGAR